MSNQQQQTHASLCEEGSYSKKEVDDTSREHEIEFASEKDPNWKNHPRNQENYSSGILNQVCRNTKDTFSEQHCYNEDIKGEDDPFFPWQDGFRTRESSVLSEASTISTSSSSCKCNPALDSRESLSSSNKLNVTRTTNPKDFDQQTNIAVLD